MISNEQPRNPSPVPEPEQDARYSAFTPAQKRAILALAASAGWFSSVSSFIYFPAIPAVAADLGVGTARVNLTVTAYLVASGVFPAVAGSAADRLGRRPALLAALAVYLAANIGLALQGSFAALFALRVLQSAGISGTYAVAYGVLGDLFAPAERGGYAGVMAFFLNTPPSIGPVLSGLLLLRWGWRSIFWFLSAATPCCLVPMLLFLPETARGIVGDGSIPASGINRAIIPILTPRTDASRTTQPLPSQSEKGASLNPLAVFRIMRFPETAIILFVYGINYAVYSCLQASLSTLLVETYGISGAFVGLSYLPFGVACALAAFSTGKLLDWNYRKAASECAITITKNKDEDLTDFPIERARLQVSKFSVLGSAVLITAYGWLFQDHTPLAGPLVLQFFIGLSIQVIFTALNTLLVDVHRKCPSTAQAACNLVRCETAAGFLAALDAIVQTIGPGWCFVLFGGLTLVLFPMLFILECRGRLWRQKRARKD
ncbi:major facilitator superfamily domain-containing protein [Camillea tinctor]|nr:major facilitator superfamily domain-containing protein [Camillea tinctor]